MSDAMLYTPHGCVLYLDLRKPVGDKLFDYSGHGNHGTIYGAKLNQELPTRGLEFDGVDDYVKVPHNDIFNVQAHSVEILLYERTFRAWDYFAGLVRKGDEITYSFEVVLYGNGEVKVWLKAGGKDYGFSLGTISLKRWYHIAYSYDCSFVKTYLNGSLTDSTPFAEALDINTKELRIAEGGNIGRRTPHGIMLLVRIYNRALSSDEIKKCFEDISWQGVERKMERGYS